MFGHQARHVIVTERYIPRDATVADTSETVIDGWYIDLDTRISCERHSTVIETYLAIGKQGSPPQKVSFTDIGERETGYMVAGTRTTTSHLTLPDGTRRDDVSTWRQEVTGITDAPLDPALFEAPGGFLDVTPGSWGYYWKAGRQWLARTLQHFVG